MTTIVVLGARGELGARVVRLLRAHAPQAELRLASRTGTKNPHAIASNAHAENAHATKTSANAANETAHAPDARSTNKNTHASDARTTNENMRASNARAEIATAQASGARTTNTNTRASNAHAEIATAHASDARAVNAAVGDNLHASNLYGVDAEDRATLCALLKGAQLVVNCMGPFDHAPRALLEAAVASGCHYADLAEDAEYNRAVFRAARACDAVGAGVAVVSGCSTVPALVELAARELARVCAPPKLAAFDAYLSMASRSRPTRALLAGLLRPLGRPAPASRAPQHTGSPSDAPPSRARGKWFGELTTLRVRGGRKLVCGNMPGGLLEEGLAFTRPASPSPPPSAATPRASNMATVKPRVAPSDADASRAPSTSPPAPSHAVSAELRAVPSGAEASHTPRVPLRFWAGFDRAFFARVLHFVAPALGRVSPARISQVAAWLLPLAHATRVFGGAHGVLAVVARDAQGSELARTEIHAGLPTPRATSDSSSPDARAAGHQHALNFPRAVGLDIPAAPPVWLAQRLLRDGGLPGGVQRLDQLVTWRDARAWLEAAGCAVHCSQQQQQQENA